MKGFEENEISINANGGTELAKRKLASIIDEQLLDNFQIICSRPRELDPEKIRIFWCHDLPEDPESKKFSEKKFKDSIHKFIFVSNWQYHRYQLIHGIPYDMKSQVIEHGIDSAPNSVIDKQIDGKIHIAYTSTPQRGLEILVPVFEKLAETHKDIHLDVYSSFKIYGWEDADKNYEPLYDIIRNHPQMTYHGFVPHEQLRSELETKHIFAYPSIWYETACRALIEAMTSGLVCVHSNLGALPDTSGCLGVMYQFDLEDKNKHANVFASYLNAAINMVRSNEHREMIHFNKIFADRRFSVGMIKSQWENTLQQLLAQYPTVESRAIPKETLIYRTT